jgi:tol-pal system protein YbgF
MAVFARASQAAAVAVAILSLAGSALAQDQGRSPNFLDNLFGNNNAQPPAATRGSGQLDDADLTVQVNQLQAQVRQLTGTIEQLQYRNQQLEQQVRALQGNSAAGPGPAPGAIGGAAYPAAQQQPRGMQQNYPSATQQNYPSATQQNYPSAAQQDYPSAAQQNYPPPVITAAPGRRSDVFDPNENPNAPGAPRPLGSLSTVAPPDYAAAQPPIGAPGGRRAGAPLDLSTPGAGPSLPNEDGLLPPPPPRNPNATGGAQLASVAPPSATPRDEFDLAFGYVQRKDYALAEDSLRAFLKKYPSDTRVADAQYWLGESFYQRQRYRDAAESFLAVTTKFDRSPKAPEALLRLGQSLAALGEKETACAAWGEIGRKYSSASAHVKKNVTAEQKRARC